MTEPKKNPHAVALGRLGGKAGKGVPKPRSAENGKKGGRPKKLEALSDPQP